MAEPRIKSLASGKELTKDQLYDVFVSQNPEAKGKVSPDDVWGMHAGLPDQYQVLSDQNPVMQTISNIPASAGRFAKGMLGLVNPETYRTVGQIGRGMYVNAIVPQDQRTPEQEQAAQMAEGAKDMIANRIRHPLETIKNDPIGAAGDLSA